MNLDIKFCSWFVVVPDFQSLKTCGQLGSYVVLQFSSSRASAAFYEVLCGHCSTSYMTACQAVLEKLKGITGTIMKLLKKG